MNRKMAIGGGEGCLQAQQCPRWRWVATAAPRWVTEAGEKLSRRNCQGVGGPAGHDNGDFKLWQMMALGRSKEKTPNRRLLVTEAREKLSRGWWAGKAMAVVVTMFPRWWWHQEWVVIVKTTRSG